MNILRRHLTHRERFCSLRFQSGPSKSSLHTCPLAEFKRRETLFPTISDNNTIRSWSLTSSTGFGIIFAIGRKLAKNGHQQCRQVTNSLRKMMSTWFYRHDFTKFSLNRL
ncbi:hypothetical protein TNCV_1295071 [Trichonephila clavipes]|nr:hypothetical protein TNCV_1295071 [Trichonephila clavipes]